MEKIYVIGIDYGTASVRSVLINARTGEELAISVFEYPRWKEGLYTIPEKNQFRQHPLDYIEGLEYVVKEVVSQVSDAKQYVKAIALDTTGSTPCLIDKSGTPLALLDKYKDNPSAMFALWKDHTAMKEAEEINKLCSKWETDYSVFSGGNYSSEWLWAKALHLIRTEPQLKEDAYTVIEHNDWIPALLTGVSDAKNIKRSRCAAGHKAMWAEQWGGFPPKDFLNRLDTTLGTFVENMDAETYTCDEPAGTLSKEWADRLGLNTDVVVGIGNTDAHSGALGAGVKYGTLIQNIGTSTCNMAVMPYDRVGDNVIAGISGQVDGSIIPGMIGFEAGMSAFGDVYEWFRNMLLGPSIEIINSSSVLSENEKESLIKELKKKTLVTLTEGAEKIKLTLKSPLATDRLNGRRNPFINYKLESAITGLNLSTTASEIYYALVEATAYGTKAIVDHFAENGVEIERIVATGGVALKSPFVMQVMADVLGKEIAVSDSEQSCALGAAMFASVLAGVYDCVEDAQDVLVTAASKIYKPKEEMTNLYAIRYKQYKELENYCESKINDLSI